MAAGTLVSSPESGSLGSSGNMPTGSGSERLRRATIHALNDDTQEILSGTAGHIYTILSIIFCEMNNEAGTIAIRINDGSNEIYLVNKVSHSAHGTFVWNDKFVIEEDDDLDVYCSSGSGDWIISYIDQDFT